MISNINMKRPFISFSDSGLGGTFVEIPQTKWSFKNCHIIRALSFCSFLTLACSGHFRNCSNIKYWKPPASLHLWDNLTLAKGVTPCVILPLHIEWRGRKVQFQNQTPNLDETTSPTERSLAKLPLLLLLKLFISLSPEISSHHCQLKLHSRLVS